jgi:hypothetical protein
MDKNPDKSILELQNDMEAIRHSMAQTLGEIRQELARGLDWQSYVQSYVKNYPAIALIAVGSLGWIIGRQLKKPKTLSPSNSDNLHERSSFKKL